MRIGLNLLHALPEIGGGWNYVANLIAAIGEWDDANTYFAFVTYVSETLVPDNPNFKKIRCHIHPFSRPQRILYENTFLQGLTRRHQLSCVHWFASVQAILNAVPAVVTVYDLQPFLNYSGFSLVKRTYLRWMMSATAKRAPMLLPMSQSTANDLQHGLGADPARMTVIPVTLEKLFKPVDIEVVTEFRAKYNLPDQFWLYVSHLYPHKNHTRLLQAYHHLKVEGFKPWPLVLRGDSKGADGDISKTVAQLGLAQDLILLPHLERSELPALYSAASAQVFPSLYEGGGIPVVEALACGCPTTASDIPAIREHAFDAAIYYDPTNVEAISQAMIRFQKNTKDREHYRQLGLKRSEVFNPKNVVKKLLKAYRQASRK